MKKRFLCKSIPKNEDFFELPPDEAHHARKVLRLKVGEIVEVIDGTGKIVQANIHCLPESKTKPILLKIIQQSVVPPHELTTSIPITLEIALIKNQAMEWIIEKAVEIGVDRLIPILSSHVVFPKNQKKERWEKIAVQSLKQCHRLKKMTIDHPIALNLALNQLPPSGLRFCCDERQKRPTLISQLNQYIPLGKAPTTIHVLIGPEGGWNNVERALFATVSKKNPLQAICISLGPQVFRSETAAICSLGIITAFAREYWKK